MTADRSAVCGAGSLRSFDVFDTVITRLVGQPASVFLLLGHRAVKAGHWGHSPERFAGARLAAEAQARHHAHPGEVTLHRIYEELAFANALGSATVEAIAAIEIELEGALIRAVPMARQQVDAARNAGHRIAFISDTYLPRQVLCEWLSGEGFLSEGDTVWVSSESGSTKASGVLFDLAKIEATASWHHLGDHPISDVANPRARGIQATLWDACKLTRYEEQMERHATASGGLASLLAGAARWLRISQPAADSAQATLRGIAAGVAGPVLWAFVTWVLLKAQRDGLRKVWFTARDGQVLLRMARRIAPKLGIELEMGYLYAGRQVVHLAGLQRIDEHALKWMTGGAGPLCANALLERVGLTAGDLSDALRRHGIPSEGAIGWDRVPVLNGFFRDEAVQTAMLAVAKDRRRDMRSYFASCGLMGDSPCAVVDIGWRGSVLRSIFDIIGPTSAARHRFLYFGLYARPVDVPEADMTAFCFDASTTPAIGVGNDVPSLTGLMEIFCQADHGQVIHVEPSADGHVARLRAPAANTGTRWDVSYFQDCLDGFAAAVQVEFSPDPGADLRPMCDQLLRMLVTAPDEAEVSVLGSVQFVDDQSGSTPQPFAEPYLLSDCRAAFRTGTLPQKALATWPRGAWALTPRNTRVLLRIAQRLGHAVRAKRS